MPKRRAMRRKPQWRRQQGRLRPDHTWKAPSGYVIVVLDRGAVRFNVPEGWIVKPAADCIEVHDAEPPDDECRLAVSYHRLPDIDFSGLPLARLVAAAIEGDRRQIVPLADPLDVPRQDLEVAWIGCRFTDPGSGREALTRLALARARRLQAILTFDFWPEDLARLDPVWAEVLRSVELGRYVDDPTEGDKLH